MLYGTTATTEGEADTAGDQRESTGKQMQDDVRSIVDALRGIGCTIVVFPMTIGEIQNNLTTMLSRPHSKRFSATHAAMGSDEVTESYVQAVAKDPELALDNVKIPVRAIDLYQFPNQQKSRNTARTP